MFKCSTGDGSVLSCFSFASLPGAGFRGKKRTLLFPNIFAELGNRGQKPMLGINYRKQWCNDIVW